MNQICNYIPINFTNDANDRRIVDASGVCIITRNAKKKTKKNRENVNKLTFNRTASDIHINISNKKRFFEYHHSRRVIKSN